MREKLKRIGRESRHNVISRRDNLILNPDRAPTIPEEVKAKLDKVESFDSQESTDGGGNSTPLAEKILSGREVSVTTFQREFELDDVLAYVKTGIASIIEDEVTQRFEAEELKVLFYFFFFRKNMSKCNTCFPFVSFL